MPTLSPPPSTLYYLLLAFGFIILSGKILNREHILFIIQITTLTSLICVVPLVTKNLLAFLSPISKALFKAFLYSLIIFGFIVWVFGFSKFGYWFIYTIGLMIALELGAFLNERNLNLTLDRIVDDECFLTLKNEIAAIKSFFTHENLIYIPIPIGFLCGTIIGTINNYAPERTILICVFIALLSFSLALLVFITRSFLNMIDSMYEQSYSSRLEAGAYPSTNKINFFLNKVRELLSPPGKEFSSDREEVDVLIAITITDLRKIYLYDSIHNCALVVTIVAALFAMQKIFLDIRVIISSIIIASFVFSQLPFVIGQFALHEKILKSYKGIKRVEMSERLKKHAPLFPTVNFISAIFAAGTGGGFIYFLFDRFIKTW